MGINRFFNKTQESASHVGVILTHKDTCVTTFWTTVKVLHYIVYMGNITHDKLSLN